MVIRKILLITVLAFVAGIAMAATAADNLQQQLDQMTTLTANFMQTVYDESGQVVQQTKGTLAIKRPGQFRWQVAKPLPRLIVARNDKIWVYDPGLEQVTIRKLTNSMGQAPLLLLTSRRTDLAQNFTVTQRNDRYTLLPKVDDNTFRQVVLTFNRGMIHTMWLQTSLGQRMVLRFTHVKMNQSLASDQFEFTPPPGIDVLNQYDT